MNFSVGYWDWDEGGGERDYFGELPTSVLSSLSPISLDFRALLWLPEMGVVTEPSFRPWRYDDAFL